jgi:hypothetical protein
MFRENHDDLPYFDEIGNDYIREIRRQDAYTGRGGKLSAPQQIKYENRVAMLVERPPSGKGTACGLFQGKSGPRIITFLPCLSTNSWKSTNAVTFRWRLSFNNSGKEKSQVPVYKKWIKNSGIGTVAGLLKKGGFAAHLIQGRNGKDARDG